MNNNRKSKELLAVSEYIKELSGELAGLLENNFPLNDTDLFFKKCMHLRDALQVEGPLAPKVPGKGKKGKKPAVSAKESVKEYYSEYQNWLLSLNYRLKLLQEVNALKKGGPKKKLELSIPNFLRWEIEQD